MWYFLTGILLYFLSLFVFKCLIMYEYNDGIIKQKRTLKLYLYQYLLIFLSYTIVWPVSLMLLLIVLIYMLFVDYECKQDKHYEGEIIRFKNEKVQEIIDKFISIWYKEL